jgi:Bacterial inner membrane protein
MLDAVGWIATVVFTVSYFAKDPTKLRWIQSVAALFWITYGILIHSRPVIAANIIVAGAAVYSSLRLFKERRTTASGVLKKD